VPGVIVAYVAGILQPMVTRTASFLCILAGPLLSILFEQAARYGFEHDLQAFHRTVLATVACYGLLLTVSLATQHERDNQREFYTWNRFKRELRAGADQQRTWWQNDKLWASALVACTLGLCWYFR
jgi:hypothetical protein